MPKTTRSSRSSRTKHTPARPSRAPRRVSASVKYNPRKGNPAGGIEITFAQKPSQAVRTSLSRAGFIWSERLGHWFALANSAKAKAEARRFDPSFKVPR